MFKSPLARKIAVTVIVKVLALFALWFFLIRPKFVHVSSADLASHLYAESPATINQRR